MAKTKAQPKVHTEQYLKWMIVVAIIAGFLGGLFFAKAVFYKKANTMYNTQKVQVTEQADTVGTEQEEVKVNY